ncbi:MAG: type I 3-dehydroquinate dehydratase [Methanophagales archaeon]|nr:type I 3-dehydroquinate dehydratase [Methanophagales archaeon]MCW3138093.1 type I 3-dehydroquinate dehydratase [Methanophagales archaeon]MCW3140125.1 type I 3-dehydroquinate dehydratase [Methanophagales archaeon]MCW7070536.1 type I 3-dehydroquinate dehydratase [Methanophagales archaeon]MCW7073675.1 type I 3-dehydroquinate dehydratase [Methanophagales archaeon]
MLKKIGNVELGYPHAPVIAAVLKRLSIDAAARAEASGAAIIELRIDLLEPEERSIEKVKEFLTSLNMSVIITNRRREEGGSFTGTEDERIEILRSIMATEMVDAVDIEFLADGRDEIIEEAKKHHIPVILSFHDFSGMPAPAEILELIDAMYNAGGSIAKIAVTPGTPYDTLNLLQLTHQVSSDGHGQLLITIGMGDWGRHLRVIAPLYGSVLTYGFIEDEAVAPGQFSVHELRDMLDKLKPLRQ